MFELYDGIRDLAGSSTARRLIVTKAQRQLELLSAGSEKDPELQRDLAAAYERMGELRIDPAQPAKANAAAALDAYQRAVALRRKIAAQPASQPRDRRDLALSLSKLGDGEMMAGNMDKALASYQESWTIAKSQPDPRALGAVDERRCIAFLTAGNTAKALESCQEGIAILSPLAKSAPQDAGIQRLIATTEASYGNALRLSRKPQDAAQQARLAVESFDRLEALAPSNAEYRRLASSAGTILALSLAATGDNSGSQEAFRKSVAIHGNRHRNRSRRPRLTAPARRNPAGILQAPSAERRQDLRPPDCPGGPRSPRTSHAKTLRRSRRMERIRRCASQSRPARPPAAR